MCVCVCVCARGPAQEGANGMLFDTEAELAQQARPGYNARKGRPQLLMHGPKKL